MDILKVKMRLAYGSETKKGFFFKFSDTEFCISIWNLPSIQVNPDSSDDHYYCNHSVNNEELLLTVSPRDEKSTGRILLNDSILLSFHIMGVGCQASVKDMYSSLALCICCHI